jgi:hypothetical protein
VSLVILWRRVPNGEWEWAVHGSKGHITCDSRDMMYIRCCENPSRLSDSAKLQFLVRPLPARNSEFRTREHAVARVSGKANCLLNDFIHVAMPAPVERGTLCAQEPSWLRVQRRIKATLRLPELANQWA